MKKLGLLATLVAGSFLAIACSHNEPAQQAGPNYTPTATTPPPQNEMQPVSGTDPNQVNPQPGMQPMQPGSTTLSQQPITPSTTPPTQQPIAPSTTPPTQQPITPDTTKPDTTLPPKSDTTAKPNDDATKK